MNDTVAKTKALCSECILNFGVLILNDETCRVEANGLDIALNPTEYRMLHFFMAHPEKVHSRLELLDRIWGKEIVVGVRTVDVHIRRLRAAMEPTRTSHLVQTVRGRGYRFSLNR